MQTLYSLNICYSIMQSSKIQRDRDMLHNVYAIGNEIPKNSAVMITRYLASGSVLECYFIRYFNIGLFVNQQKEYYLIRKTFDFSNEAYEKLKIDTRLYDMYKRK